MKFGTFITLVDDLRYDREDPPVLIVVTQAAHDKITEIANMGMPEWISHNVVYKSMLGIPVLISKVLPPEIPCVIEHKSGKKVFFATEEWEGWNVDQGEHRDNSERANPRDEGRSPGTHNQRDCGYFETDKPIPGRVRDPEPGRISSRDKG